MFTRHGYVRFAGCACAAADGSLATGGASLPPGYTSPAHGPEQGRAPGMLARLVTGADGGPRTWAIIFQKDDEVMSGLTDWMHREQIKGAHLTAIGAFSSAMFGWFDAKQHAYKDVPIDEQVECVSLIGDVGLAEGGKPALHVHGCVALPDGTMKGGHLLHAVAYPTLEVFATEAQITLHKTKDPETTLELFRLDM